MLQPCTEVFSGMPLCLQRCSISISVSTHSVLNSHWSHSCYNLESKGGAQICKTRFPQQCHSKSHDLRDGVTVLQDQIIWHLKKQKLTIQAGRIQYIPTTSYPNDFKIRQNCCSIPDISPSTWRKQCMFALILAKAHSKKTYSAYYQIYWCWQKCHNTPSFPFPFAKSISILSSMSLLLTQT